jgi:hypothetical protein
MATQTARLADFEEVLDTTEPPALGPTVRQGVETADALNERIAALTQLHGVPAPASKLVRALVLLWHDHLDEAHGIVQDLPSPEAAWIHALMHRREPDYWNSKYWWCRVGRHPALAELAREAQALLSCPDGTKLADEVTPRGQWDPFAFVDACERAAGAPPATATRKLLESIQAAEFRVLLRHLLTTA